MRSIVLCGFMGCGKTTVGQMLARELSFDFTDTDPYVAELAGESIHDMLEDNRLADVRRWETLTCEKLADRENLIISTGAGVMTREANRQAFAGKAFVVWITRDFDTLYPEISEDPVRTLAYHKSYAEMKALYESRIPLYTAAADWTVSNDGPVSDCVRKIARQYRLLFPALPCPEKGKD